MRTILAIKFQGKYICEGPWDDAISMQRDANYLKSPLVWVEVPTFWDFITFRGFEPREV